MQYIFEILLVATICCVCNFVLLNSILYKNALGALIQVREKTTTINQNDCENRIQHATKIKRSNEGSKTLAYTHGIPDHIICNHHIM